MENYHFLPGLREDLKLFFKFIKFNLEIFVFCTFLRSHMKFVQKRWSKGMYSSLTKIGGNEQKE